MHARAVEDVALQPSSRGIGGDAEGIGAFIAEDVIWRDVALGMPLHGRAAFREAASALYRPP